MLKISFHILKQCYQTRTSHRFGNGIGSLIEMHEAVYIKKIQKKT